MRTLVHLSDLHFGRVNPGVLEPLLATVDSITPDVVAVSGDLTQRARRRQFKEARAFLDALPSPLIVVPGNHDVPLYDVFRRFLQSLTRYKRYISTDLEPFYVDEELAIMGINTARALTVTGGRINARQAARLRERFGSGLAAQVKVLVTHHPFELPDGHEAEDALVGRASMVMETVAACGVDLLLAGHMHRSYVSHTAKRYQRHGYSALVVQAGTATSTRSRGEANAFNVIRITRGRITVECFTWDPQRCTFAVSSVGHFQRAPNGWTVDAATQATSSTPERP
jgi:3',5'-cyclic AMP phosphodiesterase CpdA